MEEIKQYIEFTSSRFEGFCKCNATQIFGKHLKISKILENKNSLDLMIVENFLTFLGALNCYHLYLSFTAELLSFIRFYICRNSYNKGTYRKFGWLLYLFCKYIKDTPSQYTRDCTNTFCSRGHTKVVHFTRISVLGKSV